MPYTYFFNLFTRQSLKCISCIRWINKCYCSPLNMVTSILIYILPVLTYIPLHIYDWRYLDNKQNDPFSIFHLFLE